MERLTRTIARAAAAALPALLAFALVGCPNLSLRDYVEQKVLEYDLSQNPRPILVLKDGTTTIPAGGAITMPNAIFGVMTYKSTLTIENHGNRTLTLGGTAIGMPTADAGSNYMPIQPVVFSIAPGGPAVAFDIYYQPINPDTDYHASFVINSDDPNDPAYAFSATGHSTQWHGSKAVVSSPTAVIQGPQIAIAGTNIYVTYLDSGIKMTRSQDGGKTWSSPITLYPTSYWHSIAASGNNLHLFFYDTSGPALRYYKSTSFGTGIQNVTYWSVNTNYQGIMNSAIVLANSNVYLCFNDTTNSKLQIAVSGDYWPGMSFTTYDVTGGTTGQTGGFYPSLKVSGSTLFVTYRDGTNSKVVRLAKTSNLSGPWTYSTVATDASSNIAATALAVDTSGHVLWSVSDGSETLHSKNSTDGLTMANWTADASLTPENAKLSVPLPFVSAGGALYALRFHSSASSGIRLSKSADGGSTWSHQWLDQQVGVSGAKVSLAVDGQNVYAVYDALEPSEPVFHHAEEVPGWRGDLVAGPTAR